MKLRNLLYLVPLMLVGCDVVEFGQYEELTPGSVKVSQTSAEYSYAGGTTEFTVTSLTPWVAEFLKEEDAPWVTVNPSSGNAGQTKVTITIKPFAPKDLARDNVIRFVAEDGSAAGFSFKQAWAEPKTEYTFNKATEIVDGRSYLIVANGLAATVQPKAYDYLKNPASVIDEEGSIRTSNKSFAWTFTKVDGGYTIKGSDDRYMYQTGTFNSFNFSAERVDGDVWTVEFLEDGSAKINNVSVNKYIQYSTGYGSYGSYASAQSDGVIPCLYEEEVDPNAATLIPAADTVWVSADATSATVDIVSNNEWAAESDADWLFSYTKGGNGDGSIEFTFAPNKSFDDVRTAELTVYGSGISAKVVLVQKAAEPFFNVPQTKVSVESYKVIASFKVETNLPWEVECPSGVTAINPSGEGSATVYVSFLQNTTNSNIEYSIKVKTPSERVEVREYTVVLKHKTDFKVAFPYGQVFEDSMDDFSINDVKLPEGADYVWSLDSQNHYMKASAYIGGKNKESESWLVSPSVTLPESPASQVSVKYAMNYGTPALYTEQMYGLVIEGDNQTRIDFKNTPSKGSWTFYTEDFDLSPWAGKSIRFALVYTSTDQAAATFEVKSIVFDEKTYTLAELNAMATSGGTTFNAKVKDVVVSYVNGQNAFVEDATAGTQIYLKNHGLSAGKKIDGAVSGTIKLYQGFGEITALDYSAATVSDTEFTPKKVTVAQLLENYSFYVNRLVNIEGISVTDGIKKDDRDGVISQDGSEINIRAAINGVTINTGTNGDLLCIPTLYSGNKQLSVYEDAFFTVDDGSSQKYTASFFGKNISWGTPVSIDNVDWVFTSEGGDGINAGDETKGKQFGTKSKPCTKLTLKGNYSGKVTKVTVESCCASNTGPKIDHVSVGGKVLAAPESTDLLKNENKAFVFTSAEELTGEVEIVWTNSASAGIYVKAVTLE